MSDGRTTTIEVRQTSIFRTWFADLRDQRAQARIIARIDRLTLGNLGDVKSLSGGLSELRIDYGGGYRLYFTRRGVRVVLLLCGGDKSSQRADIARAREIAAQETDDGH